MYWFVKKAWGSILYANYVEVLGLDYNLYHQAFLCWNASSIYFLSLALHVGNVFESVPVPCQKYPCGIHLLIFSLVNGGSSVWGNGAISRENCKTPIIIMQEYIDVASSAYARLASSQWPRPPCSKAAIGPSQPTMSDVPA